MVITNKPTARASAFLIDNLLSSESSKVTDTDSSAPTAIVHPAFRDSKQTTIVTVQSACVEREMNSDSENSSFSETSSCCSSPEPTSPKESLSGSSGGPVSKKKKNRTSFSNHQLQQLEMMYRQQRYLPADERTQMARRLKLSEQQVKTWFQNRRMKEKRQFQDSDVTHDPTSPVSPVLPHFGYINSHPAAAPFSGLPIRPAAVPSSGLTMPMASHPLMRPLAVSVPGSGYTSARCPPVGLPGFTQAHFSSNGLLMVRY